jgi:hypothetical protein
VGFQVRLKKDSPETDVAERRWTTCTEVGSWVKLSLDR